MENGIEHQVVEEGHVRAVKCTGDFGGPNMWNFYVKDANGCFGGRVQWMSVDNVQRFFKTKLPRYEKVVGEKYKRIS